MFRHRYNSQFSGLDPLLDIYATLQTFSKTLTRLQLVQIYGEAASNDVIIGERLT